MGFFGTKNAEAEDGASQSSVRPNPEPTTGTQPSSGPPEIVRTRASTAAPRSVGIDDTMQLVRSLPIQRDPQLVITVLKQTLEFLHIRVADIIADAARRQQELESRVAH